MQNNNNTESNYENVSEQENEIIDNFDGNNLNIIEFNSNTDNIINISDNDSSNNGSSTDPQFSSSSLTNEIDFSSNSNTNPDSIDNNFNNENFLEIVTDNSSLDQDDFINSTDEMNYNTINFDSYDDSSEFEIANEFLGKRVKEKASLIPPVQGTMYQQAYNMLVLNDIISPNIICYCGNNDTNSCEKDSISYSQNNTQNDNNDNDIDDDNTNNNHNYHHHHGTNKMNNANESNDILFNFIYNNNKKNKNDNVFSSTPVTSEINLKKEKNFFKHRARPTLPLTLQPTKNRNRYTYCFFYNTSLDTYYENSPPVTVKPNWREGISNLHLNIQKNLK